MTNMVIKALELCKDPTASCDECFLVNADRYCERTLMGTALDLINRQKAELERLKEQVNLWQEEAGSVGCENEWLKASLKEKNAEVEDLKKDINHYKINLPYLEHQSEDFCGVPCSFMENLVEKAKAEAIKEFAERLKPKLSYYDEEVVDNLVKEWWVMRNVQRFVEKKF